ncbi:MAG: XTP/dITP diphosphatase [Acidobacteriota bacterium]
MPEILIATKNKNKTKELKELLSNTNFVLKDLTEIPNINEVIETGKTFTENAVLKAKSYALQTKKWSLADDSGLEVKALNGAPGVFSARYAGKTATDKDNVEKLLRELKGVVDKQRQAKFVCAVAISNEKGEVKFIAEGVCEGKIAVNPSGSSGFGYDPIFIPDGFEQTFGELSVETKQKISHRARAAAKIIRFFADFTA